MKTVPEFYERNLWIMFLFWTEERKLLLTIVVAIGNTWVGSINSPKHSIDLPLLTL